jgi:hypothetical protein
MRTTRIALTALLGAGLSACAVASKAPPAASPSPAAEGSYGYAQPQPGAYPSTPAQAPPPPPPAPQATTPGQPSGGAPGGRSLALQSAASDVESSQRELDVAAGDCRNACRALGSMDRAAGRLCELSQGSDEGRRCDEAKQRVYSARDRVKTTCGVCPGGPSVDRTAPIPSLR